MLNKTVQNDLILTLNVVHKPDQSGYSDLLSGQKRERD